MKRKWGQGFCRLFASLALGRRVACIQQTTTGSSKKETLRRPRSPCVGFLPRKPLAPLRLGLRLCRLPLRRAVSSCCSTMGATHQRSTGYRSGTRDLFSKKFRTKMYNPSLTTYLRTFHVGDFVDIVANPAQQKGMPHKYYHGRTGKVWNVTKRWVLLP